MEERLGKVQSRGRVQLNQQLFDGFTQVEDLRLQLAAFIGGHGTSDDWTRYTACTSQGLLGRHEHIRHVLVFGQERQVKQDLNGFGISRHDHKLADSSVQRLGSCIMFDSKQPSFAPEDGATFNPLSASASRFVCMRDSVVPLPTAAHSFFGVRRHLHRCDEFVSVSFV